MKRRKKRTTELTHRKYRKRCNILTAIWRKVSPVLLADRGLDGEIKAMQREIEEAERMQLTEDYIK